MGIAMRKEKEKDFKIHARTSEFSHKSGTTLSLCTLALISIELFAHLSMSKVFVHCPCSSARVYIFKEFLNSKKCTSSRSLSCFVTNASL